MCGKFFFSVVGVILLAACSPAGSKVEVPSQTQLEAEVGLAPEATVSGIMDATESGQEKAEPTKVALEGDMVVLKTSKGEITLQLYPKDAPKTVDNFLTKAASGFYEGLTFHRVEDWVVQGGDPDGTGAGGGTMTAEYNKKEFKIGSLGIARGMDRKINNDSQFFICTDDCSWLTGDYTNFGEVVEGMEVVKQIAIGDTIASIQVADEQ